MIVKFKIVADEKHINSEHLQSSLTLVRASEPSNEKRNFLFQLLYSFLSWRIACFVNTLTTCGTVKNDLI